ncbi:NBR1-Ig-like domain-containing protein [Actinomadura sp. 3N508]|uniref:NBR1-Ig-like domain-containing protein n=1 Tax=Actinomadura sp. 3N508 TaxID=3375153 RepID=UPI0037B5A5CD
MSESGVLSSAGGQEGRDRFAERLRRLRAEAGNPSFRVMAAKSRSVSHATLHEAAKGTRFPSWITTQAFVEACGGDVEEWREYWCAALGSDDTAAAAAVAAAEQADAPLVQADTASLGDAEAAPLGDADTAPIARIPGAAAGDDPAAVAELIAVPVARRKRRRRAVALVLGCGALGGAAVGVSMLQDDGEGKPKSGAKAAPQPVVASGPVVPGDRSVFIADVTIPDGMVVNAGQQFTKTWEIANAGTVPWRGRFLARATLPADNGTCMTPGKVPIPDTEPGARVRVSVRVTAPSSPGSCWVGWKMVDGSGRQLLPGARPIYFVVNVRR